MGVVGLAAPLIVPSVRQSMGYPTDNYYGLKSRCGELDYGQMRFQKQVGHPMTVPSFMKRHFRPFQESGSRQLDG